MFGLKRLSLRAPVEYDGADPEEVLAMSLTQPWASFIPAGDKTIETRGWQTGYRGLLLIQATRQAISPALPLPTVPLRLLEAVASWDDLPRGAFVAVARLTHVRRIAEPIDGGYFYVEDGTVKFHQFALPYEGLLGDYSPGRFAWHLADVRALPTPIPARGYQMLWHPTPGQIADINAAFARAGEPGLFG